MRNPGTSHAPRAAHPWTHRWAWLLCCATFPLVWIGGLITTTDAGMAVPDWPGTYGYNLFLYPWSTWLLGPWDLFIEHGHRLFASAVGMLTIGLVFAAHRTGAPNGVRRLAWGALALVLLQGVLGGMRVRLNERILAMAHGSTGPLFFALTAALVMLTAPRAAALKGGDPLPDGSAFPGARGRLRWVVLLLPVATYLQVIAGASLRHAPEGGRPLTFAEHAVTHLILAGVVAGGAAAVAVAAWRWPVGAPRRIASAMGGIVVVQLGLGVATWVTKYRLPAWAPPESFLPGGAVARWLPGGWADALAAGTIGPSLAGGWSETLTVTAHAATGALLLALATALAVAALCERSPSRPEAQS